MDKVSFDTLRLNFRPLERSDVLALCKIVRDEQIVRFFDIGVNYEEVFQYVSNLITGGEVHFGIFPKSDSNVLIGSIVGYRMSSCELLVEYFIDKYYRHQGFMTEALSSYLTFCRMQGYCNFRFYVDPTNLVSKSILSNFSAKHFENEDFGDNKHKFEVYRIC